jgi:hypothetical protein
MSCTRSSPQRTPAWQREKVKMEKYQITPQGSLHEPFSACACLSIQYMLTTRSPPFPDTPGQPLFCLQSNQPDSISTITARLLSKFYCSCPRPQSLDRQGWPNPRLSFLTHVSDLQREEHYQLALDMTYKSLVDFSLPTSTHQIRSRYTTNLSISICVHLSVRLPERIHTDRDIKVNNIVRRLTSSLQAQAIPHTLF